MHNLPTKSCNGCSACVQLCPVQAITMEVNDEGFLYPIIDEYTCIHCNQCEMRCPVLHAKNSQYGFKEIVAYGCINTNEEIRKNSSSGGMFSIFAENIIRQGGVVHARLIKKREQRMKKTDTIIMRSG